ncbi:RNA-directed DNA polymerase, eukaryota, nucleotide-binding alpha-beta plait domain protein [Tanacetum coccineum]
MAIGTGHRSNNYSESKRNNHLDNNCRQEQRNKGIPYKSHPNFHEKHKSFSSIFVSNIPWNASVQDLWDICNKWGVVINVYIAAKRSKSGHVAKDEARVCKGGVHKRGGNGYSRKEKKLSLYEQNRAREWKEPDQVKKSKSTEKSTPAKSKPKTKPKKS